MNELLYENINKLKKAIESNKRLMFLVGAGISFGEPSYLTTWPQSGCIKVLSTLDSDIERKLIEAVRPEVFFQVLYNVIGKKALIPLEVVNPVTLNLEEELVAPNILHLFLADMMLKGHLVLTTNFDDLIERAYKKRTRGKEPKVVISDNAFQNLYNELNSQKAGCLIKIHGSFVTPDGKDCRESIIAILQQVQREFPESRRKLVKKLITEHDVVVMGYSGQDDYDIYPFLLESPLDRYIWWIRHKEEPVEPEKWDAILKPQLVEENKSEGSKSAPLRNYRTLNPNSIVVAYSHGVLIKAHTVEFVKLLGKYQSTSINIGHKAKVEQATQAILKQWVSTLNSAEKYYILAGIFEAAGRDFLDNAKEYYSKAYETESNLLATQNILKRGIISYKKDSRSELENAKNELEEALKEFEKLSSIPYQAETCLQLVLVCNRLGITEKGIEHGEKAINLYKQLVELDDSYIFELAQVMRVLALISMRAIPDISTITSAEEIRHCTKILEEATKLCKISLKFLQKIGNRSGERGEGQTYNVLGMIQVRLGDYQEAKAHFDKVLDLSGRSRFLRESFQGYRNVALCEYNLALKEPEKKNEWLKEALQNYDFAIECLGSDPKLPNQQSRSTDEFNVRYNRSQAKIERSEPRDTEFAIKELTTLKSAAQNWHWRANILASLRRAYLQLNRYEEALNCMEEMLKEYEGVIDKDIEKQPFGVQNAQQNLQAASDWIGQISENKEIIDIHQRVVGQLKRIDNLAKSQYAPLIPIKDWSAVFSQIEAKFLK